MAEAKQTLPKLTDRYALGASGLEVSPVCLGMVADPAIIPAAYDAGINFFFITADMHWPLYDATRAGLFRLFRDRPEAREKIVVGVVSYVSQPEFGWLPFREVVDSLPGLSHIDLTIAGGSYGHEIEQRLVTYEKHRADRYLGTRATGVTFHDRPAIVPVLDRHALDIAFVRYNPIHPGAEKDVFPQIRDDHPLLYNFKSAAGHFTEAQYKSLGLGDDYWFPHITEYYRFALTQPALDGLLVSLPHVAAVGELADALAKGPLNDEDRQYLLDLGELATGKAKVASG
jgi:hypothetical protein